MTEKAILFDQKGKSCTHIILNQDALENSNIEIVAYFSLAIHLLGIPEGTSPSQIKRLDGLYSRKGSAPLSEVPSFLIGQLAKNDRYSAAISGSLLLEYALSAIYSAKRIVGGRVVYIECRNEPKLISFYEGNGFKALRRDPNDGLVQMCRLLCK